MTLRNIRLLLEYDGTRYHGWQRQADAVTIQGVVEAAVARLTGESIALIGSETGPDLGKTLAALGRDETLGRLRAGSARLGGEEV